MAYPSVAQAARTGLDGAAAAAAALAADNWQPAVIDLLHLLAPPRGRFRRVRPRRGVEQRQPGDALRRLLEQMPPDEAQLHMKRCIDSGLWDPQGAGSGGSDEAEESMPPADVDLSPSAEVDD